MASRYPYVGWMIGRVTMAKYLDDVSQGEPAALRPADAAAARGWAVDPKGRKLAVGCDFHGNLHYGSPVQTTGEQIVTMVSDRVSDEYLAELKEAGVGVVTVPPDGHEFEHALKILPHDYGDGIWMLEGGGKINAAFLQAGLINEISTIVCPALDATRDNPSIYQALDPAARPAQNVSLRLKKAEPLQGGAVWLNYDVLPARR